MDHLKSNTSSNPYNFWRLIRIKMLASVCDMSSEHPLVTNNSCLGRPIGAFPFRGRGEELSSQSWIGFMTKGEATGTR